MPRVPSVMLSALPDGLQTRVRDLFPMGEPGPLHEMRALVEEHVRETAKAAAKNEFVDTTLAYTIAQRLRIVLEDWPSLTQDERAAVHAAIAYFALSEDAEDDLESVLGFEDDAQVVNACLRLLDRSHLEIPTE
jgi:uncharacterized membrane protein YkvA (DUF1232 family)